MIGKVYFVAGPGRIKIGFTAKPEQRLKQLQAMDMEKLEVIAIGEGTRELERKLHEMVRDHHLRGEWFNDCSAVRSVMNDFVAGKFPIDAVEADAPEEPSSKIHTPLLAAVRHAKAMADDIQMRMVRGERETVKALVHSMCDLTESLIVPQLRALDSPGNKG